MTSFSSSLRQLISRTMPAVALTGLVAVSVSGCYTTRIHTGLQGTTPSLLATDRWHHAVVGGLAEISDPVDLEASCPGGWATINEQFSFLNGLATGATGGIYTPRTYTVTCGGGAGAATTPAGWGAAGAPPPAWGAPAAPPPATPR